MTPAKISRLAAKIPANRGTPPAKPDHDFRRWCSAITAQIERVAVVHFVRVESFTWDPYAGEHTLELYYMVPDGDRTPWRLSRSYTLAADLTAEQMLTEAERFAREVEATALNISPRAKV